ncbi:MAG: hypothetical protein WHS44_12195 [Fimbriimonadales bacterium]|nr:MAG: hypothetical protein KatS3mg018_2146 [Fimbriimonadales bacterium]
MHNEGLLLALSVAATACSAIPLYFVFSVYYHLRIRLDITMHEELQVAPVGDQPFPTQVDPERLREELVQWATHQARARERLCTTLSECLNRHLMNALGGAFKRFVIWFAVYMLHLSLVFTLVLYLLASGATLMALTLLSVLALSHGWVLARFLWLGLRGSAVSD